MDLLDREDVLDNRSEMSIAMDNWVVVESSVVLTISLPGQVRLGVLVFFSFFHILRRISGRGFYESRNVLTSMIVVLSAGGGGISGF